jgi:surface protein
MGTTADKLAKLRETKGAIKSAIVGKGVEIADEATFADYATELDKAVITPLGQLGYSAEDEAVYDADLTFDNSTLREDLAYSKEIAANWDASMTNAVNKFINDTQLKYLPLLDTGSVTNMSYMFYQCSSLTTIPLLDTGSVTNMSYMFYQCSSLTTIPLLDTGSVTNMSYMFYQCSSLTTIPLLDTGSVTNMLSTFNSCSSLTSIPALDTGSVTNMYHMFFFCTALKSIPQLNTSKVTNMQEFASYCSSLTKIEQIDMSSVVNLERVFLNDKALVYVLIKNLGKSELAKYGFDYAENWGTGSDENRQSLVDSLLTYSYDRAANGMESATIQLSSASKALLTDEELAAITAKGFTIA